MPFEKRYDEQQVLENAMRAFWARGYEGTSISDLTRATGINRGSMYTAFADKRDLFVQALKHYDQTCCKPVLDRLSQDCTPRAALRKLFEGAVAGDGTDGNPAGCLLVNTAMEMSPHDDDIRELVNDSLAAVQANIEAMIVKAQAAGEVPATVDPHHTAASLLGLLIGLRVLARSNANPDTLAAIAAQAMALLD